MWVMTTQGFYSAVAHRDEPENVIVRARTRDDIEALREQIPDIEPFEDPSADYRHRAIVSKAEWVAALADLAAEIDYDNFKNAVARAQGAERSHVYGAVWSTLLPLQRLTISDRTSSVEEEAPPLPQLIPSGFYGYLKPSTCGLRVWLREQGDVEEDPPSAFGEMLMRLGIEHERRHLERFPNHIDIGKLPWDEQPEATIEEVGLVERVIYQGHLRAETTLAGRAGRDHRPARLHAPRAAAATRSATRSSTAPSAPSTEHVRLQLETYGWLYEQTFGEPPVALQVHTGSDQIQHLEYEGGGDALATFEQMLIGANLRAGAGGIRRRLEVLGLQLPLPLLAAGGAAPGRRPAPRGRPEPRRRAPSAGHRHPAGAARAVRRREPRRLRATLGGGEQAGRRSRRADADQCPGDRRGPADPDRATSITCT